MLEWRSRVAGGVLGGATGGAGGWAALSRLDRGALVYLVLVLAVVLLAAAAYLLAGRLVRAGPGAGELGCGLLLGLNAGLNGALGAVILHPVAGAALGLLVGVAAVPAAARDRRYQPVAGWANLVLPMSWPVTGLGAVFFAGSLLLHGVTAGRVRRLRVVRLLVHASSGTCFMVGGLAGNANANPHSTGYNLGNFAFLRASAGATPYLVQHESGHTLNLAAFGAVFHLAGAVEENLARAGRNAYAELHAESHVPAPARMGRFFPMWGG